MCFQDVTDCNLVNSIAGDLHASEITMSDDDRIELMIKVKEGKLSMHDAVEIVSVIH